jgi:hypothetical protein
MDRYVGGKGCGTGSRPSEAVDEELRVRSGLTLFDKLGVLLSQQKDQCEGVI